MNYTSQALIVKKTGCLQWSTKQTVHNGLQERLLGPFPARYRPETLTLA